MSWWRSLLPGFLREHTEESHPLWVSERGDSSTSALPNGVNNGEGNASWREPTTIVGEVGIVEGRSDNDLSNEKEKEKEIGTSASSPLPELMSSTDQYNIIIDVSDEGYYLDSFYRDRAGAAAGSLAEEGWRSWLNWQTFKKRFPYYVPILIWAPQYSFVNDFPRDLMAGIAVGAMIIPQSLALAILAGLPAIYGLYSCWISSMVYACFGNSRTLSFGPETVASILLGLTLDGMDDSKIAAFAHIISFLSGILLFVLGVFRFGFLDNLISRPLLAGFINAVACVIMLDQVDNILGIPKFSVQDFFSNKVSEIYGHIKTPNWVTVVVAVVAIFFLFLFRITKSRLEASGSTRLIVVILKNIPGILVVVLSSILLSYLIRLDKYDVDILGKISDSSFPAPYPPEITSLDSLRDGITPAITISILGFLESIIVAKHYASKYNYPVSPNRELVAMGLANVVGSFFLAMPSFGSLTRSAVADAAGAKTQMYQFVVAIIVASTILFLQPLFYYLPKAVLSAVIIVAAFGLLELEDLLFLWKLRSYPALFLMAFTFVMTILLGVEYGILLSLGISVLLIIRQTSFPHIAILGYVPRIGKFRDISLDGEAKAIPGIVIIRIEEALYFANVGQIREMFGRIERIGSHVAHPSEKRQLPSLRGIIIDARNILDADASAMHTLHSMIEDYHKRNIKVCFVKLRGKLKKDFISCGIIGSMGGDMLFSRLKDAMAWIDGKDTYDHAFSTYPADGRGSSGALYSMAT